MICSVARYRTHTLDTTSAAASASAALVTAQALVEEALDRWLEVDQRTETLRVRQDGRVFPRAVPVTVPPAGAVSEFHGRALRGVTWDSDPLIEGSSAPTATVTYSGGYLPFDHEDATETNRVPVTIEREVARIAQGLLAGGSPNAGATSVRLGDAAVTYATPLEQLDAIAPGASSALRRYRRAVL